MNCRKAIVCCYIFFMSFLCAENDFYIRKFNAIEKEQLKVSVNYFQELVEESLFLRTETLRFAKDFEKLEKNDHVLSGKEIERIQIGIQDNLKLRNKLYSLIALYSNYEKFKTLERSLFDAKSRLKGTLLSLATVTVLYDNYALALATIYNNGTLRRMVNRANKGFHLREDEFDKVVESFHDPKKRERIRKAFEKLDKYNGQIEKLKKTDKQVNYLCFLIDQSPSVKDIKNGDEFGDYINKFRLWKKSSRDSLIRAGESSVNAASKLFGNSMGMIQFGDGKLYKDKAVEADMRAQLKPLDILLEKTPFRLTDKFIPGHYGHVAIWLGSEAELKRYNLWDHPQIKPYQQKIREGKCVLEALRDGVQLNTLAHFLNVDDIAVLRCRQLNVKMLMPKAFRQIGKEYDFNFDVETIDKIVCSELVYQVFTSMTWPTERTMGRSTISPDNVAVKAQGGGPLELRVLYHDGLKIHKDKQVKFAKLLKGE